MPPAPLRTIARLVCATFLLATCAAAAVSAPPPVEAFAALPTVSDVGLSPNGNLIAWVDRSGSDPRAVILDLTTGKVRHQIAIGKSEKLVDLTWADDETVLIEVSQPDTATTAEAKRYRLEIYRWLAVNVNSGKSNILLMTDGARQFVNGATLEAPRTAKPKTVVMSTLDYSIADQRSAMDTRLAGHHEDSGWISKLFEVDTISGKGRALESGSQFTDEWVVDADGHCVARSEWNPKLASYRILAKRNIGWDEIYSRKDGATLTLHGVVADGSAIVAIGPNDSGRRVLYAIPLNGSAISVLFEDPNYDVAKVERDQITNTPVGVQLGGPLEEFRWFDKAAQARYESVARAFKGRSVAISGRSQDGKRVLAKVQGPSQPAIYYLVDFNKHTADIAGEEYPALANAALGEVRSISYKARDGMSIPAYLTLPPGADAKNLPLVVLAHGGPEARDDYGFNWWTQFLATRGYAVLQPQFRGSTGFGDAFRRAGYRQWGGLMQDDVTDGVQAMIEQGIADAKRVCIVGASYGGYAALAGAAFTPDLYKCAVSVNGISDLPAMMSADKDKYGDDDPAVVHLRDTIGSAYDKAVIERSPVHSANRLQIPVLLIHGLDDTVVRIDQSEMMAHALAGQRKNYSFVKLPGGDHWLTYADTRQQVMKEIEKFLAANL
jgi:dipeptidyl aminopeptidase/acylaminoacyl peptidase